MTHAGKARRCAQSVLDTVTSGRSNWRYNANYFGQAMRGHLAQMNRLGETVPAHVREIVGRAEDCMKAYCDGKDCSFVVTPLG